MRRIAIIACLTVLVGIVPAAQAASSAPASKQDRATYLGVRHAAKKAGVRVGPKIAKRAHTAHSHAIRTRVMRAELRAKHAKAHIARVGVSPQLAAIAACESGGDPTAIGGGGAFRGKYQFTYSTWASVGGSGDPAAAPEAEQDRRAAALLAREGTRPWPVCGAGG